MLFDMFSEKSSEENEDTDSKSDSLKGHQRSKSLGDPRRLNRQGWCSNFLWVLKCLAYKIYLKMCVFHCFDYINSCKTIGMVCSWNAHWIYAFALFLHRSTCTNKMTSSEPEALVDIRWTTQYLQLTTWDWVHPLFQNISNEQACMFRSSWLFIGTHLTVDFLAFLQLQT